ncbi:hypothetical protein [Candidatus Pseudoruminococcus sp.]|uniref:hypothetical protein n=1 Tax=Candidatus Pseudoruminococcus sp. TaxID=3101048 RepID=UPI00399B6499
MEIAVVLIIFLFWIALVVGICALFVWICKKIAESKGLPSSYMWFGLLGVLGIVIVAVMGPSYPQYPQYPSQNGQNPYQQQNNYNQPNTYFGNNPYQQPQQPQQQQSYCPHCGAPVDGYSITCDHCGQMLR